MKKMLTLGLVLALMMMFTVGVMADGHDTGPGFDEPDWEYGEGIFEGWSALEEPFFAANPVTHSDHVIIKNLNPNDYPKDFLNYEVGDQEATVIIPAVANIPCYIRFTLTGNGSTATLKSLGANSTGTVNWNNASEYYDAAGSHVMLFDARMSGFIDEYWNAVGAEDPEFSTIPNKYITACDLWTAEIYSNLNYRLGVSADTLEGRDDTGNELTIEMRYTNHAAPGWSNGFELPELDDEITIGDFDATDTTTLTMQFRVPFENTAADRYTGDVYFKAYTF